MPRFLLSAGIKLLVGIVLLCGAYYVVNHSNYYYLFIGNILLLLGLAFLVEGTTFILFALIKNLRNRKAAIISTSRSTFVVLFLADFIIRMIGVMQTYPERTDGKYFSLSTQENLDSWYWLHTPNTLISNQKKEFLFNREVNSIGLSEKEIPKEKGTKFRIIAIGDSFTEGVGMSYEDSWVKQMEHRWKWKNVETINGGIGGSDPIYEFALYRDKLIAYKPDVLVLTINSTDVDDVAGRGGFERFHADGTAGKTPPSWEWIYASNHLFRMFTHAALGYNTSLLRGADTEEAQLKAIENLKDVLGRLKKLSNEEDTKLLVVLQPSIQEFKNGKHTPFFGQIELAKYLKAEQIYFLDTSNDFEKKGVSVSEYYYPIDTHFNKKGYALFGKSVYEKIEELGFLETSP
ncbi:MAG: hypothetical protein COA38_18805 [Fluviicola sp.]|nr:MAG: hypothetical protein COA38_18805 [Fluviicola sp.]